jgi:hypothetical protein
MGGGESCTPPPEGGHQGVRPYYDSAPHPIIVRAGAAGLRGGDPCGRPPAGSQYTLARTKKGQGERGKL